MAKLDLKDRRILSEIALNSRFFVSEIAKKVRLSKDVIKYRLKVLEDKGVITRYQTMINVSKLGLMNFKVSLNLVNATNEIYDEIIEYVKSLSCVVSIRECDTVWDIIFKVLVKNPLEFEKVYDDFKQKFINYIESDLIEIITQIDLLPKNYLYETSSEKLISIQLGDKVAYDKFDLKILKLMSNNARISLLELAEKVGRDSMTVKRRIDRLVKEGVIAGFQTFMDPRAVDFMRFNVGIDLFDAKKIKMMQEYILRIPNVVMMEKSIGGYDLRFNLEVSSYQEYEKIMKDFKDKFLFIREIIQFSTLRYHRMDFFSRLDKML